MKSYLTHLGILFCCAIVYSVDTALPLGIAGGVPYVAVILIACAAGIERNVLLYAVLCSGLTVLAYYTSPAGADTEHYKILTNRGLAIFAIWSAAILSGVAIRRGRFLNKFASSIEGMPNGLLVVDKNGKIVLANPFLEKMFGFGRKELLGTNVDLLVPEEIRVNHPELRKSYLENPIPRELGLGRELFGVKKGGVRVPVEIGLSSVSTTEGFFVIASVIDLTERKKAELTIQKRNIELERSNKELEQFAYVASHDLRAPLRAIENLSNWIKEDLGEIDPEVDKKLNLMRSRISRMDGLLDSLLTYSRVGRKEGEPEEVDTKELVGEIVELHEIPKGFTAKYDPNLPSVYSKRVPLQQVFMNLFSNALKHRESDSGHIDISFSDEGEFICFSVKDDGAGIDPKFHDRIFKMFQTLKPRDHVEGSGMGLALVKKIVNSRGGKVWVESQPGKGCTFYFQWPKKEIPAKDVDLHT